MKSYVSDRQIVTDEAINLRENLFLETHKVRFTNKKFG